MANENDILQALADRADEENRERDAKLNGQFTGKKKGKRKGKNQNNEEKPKSEISEEKTTNEEESLPEPISRDTGEMEPVSEVSAPLPEISASESDDPFSSMVDQMSKEGEVLSASRKKKNTPAPEPKLKGVKGKEIGEEVTKEHAEQLISEKKTKGHRRTVIVRTQVVDNSSDEKPASREKSKKAEPEEKSFPKLRIVRSDTGEAYDLDSDLTIGRDDDNDIAIPNPEGHYVSSHHAEIKIQGKDVFVKDLQSTNGTYINDRKVGSYRLRAGNVLEFADIKFEVEEI